MSEPLLTIAIPTYNRAEMLDSCLIYLAKEFSENPDVEILVSNNASTDNTATIVAKHQATSFKNLKYFANEKNLGLDYNFAQCFREATGKYVWIFSDDDLLLPSYGASVLALLDGSEWGVVHLKSNWFDGDVIPYYAPKEFKYQEYHQDIDFVKEVNYWVTFITGNIVNKRALVASEVTYDFFDTYLVQLGWILPGIFTSLPNVLVMTPVLACRANNTGGYKLFHTFAINFNTVMLKLVEKKIITNQIRDIINEHLISGFFPGFIKINRSSFSKESILGTLFKAFKGYSGFWTKLVPLYYQSMIKAKIKPLNTGFKRLVAKFVYKVIRSDEYAKIDPSGVYQVKLRFRNFGNNSNLPSQNIIHNPQYISIGKNFNALFNLRIEAWDSYAGKQFLPEIIIGDNVNMNTDCHIGCINKVVIGNNVLLASRVYISDHSHGKLNGEELSIAPAHRELFSKGAVIVEDNVWIGEGVCVMPGVTIGRNSIIGANAVVTKDIPANSIAAGIPAKVIRSLV